MKNEPIMCGNCKYWNWDTTECKRYPPVLNTELAKADECELTTAFFVQTDEDDWCGEWVDEN